MFTVQVREKYRSEVKEQRNSKETYNQVKEKKGKKKKK